MCEYCNDIVNYNNKDLIRLDKNHSAFLYHQNDNEYSLDVEFNGNELSYISINIEYCPKCGRKL